MLVRPAAPRPRVKEALLETPAWTQSQCQHVLHPIPQKCRDTQTSEMVN